MSSRAKLVDIQPRPYDWHTMDEVPAPPQITVETVAAIEPEPVETPEAAAAVAQRHEERLAEIEHDAYAKGHEEGARAGAEEAGHQALGLLRHLAETIEELSSTRQDMLRRTERQVVELAMAIARQMLQRELNIDRGLLLAMARVALDGLGDHAPATIHLHPDDYALVKAAPDQAWTAGHVTIVADPAVDREGCLVQCDAGLMKVGLDSQFTELTRTLLGEQDGDVDREEARRGTSAAR